MKLMPYIAPEVVQEVKRMDLLTYLKTMSRRSLCIFREYLHNEKSRQSEDFQREMDVVESEYRW